MVAEGLTTIKSNNGPRETMDRLEAEMKSKGLTVFAHIDHAAGAAQVGLPLCPTDLLIFGNARGGTPLMQANQKIGIDLPLKNPGLAGSSGHHMAFLQRPELASEALWARRRFRSHRQHVG